MDQITVADMQLNFLETYLWRRIKNQAFPGDVFSVVLLLRGVILRAYS